MNTDLDLEKKITYLINEYNSKNYNLVINEANAVINNRNESDLSDLKVLRFLLPFRVPEDILEAAEQKLESFENQKKKTKK